MRTAYIVIGVRLAFYLAVAAVVAVMLGCQSAPRLIDPVCVTADDKPCKD